MSEMQTQVLVVGGGPLALITALMLHHAGLPVVMTGEAPPTNPPLNPELMLVGGDDSLPPLFQSTLKHWRNLSELLGLPTLIVGTPAQDLATSEGRMEKLRTEAMFDAIGGEPVVFTEGAPAHAPSILGAKNWEESPMLLPATLALLQQAIASAGIQRLMLNPASLSVEDLSQPQVVLEDGTVVRARHVIFASARALRKVLPPLGLSLPLRPARGHVLMLQTAHPHHLPLMLQRLHRGHLFMVPVGPTRVDVHYDAINDPAQSTFNIQHSASLVTALQQHVGLLVPVLAGATLVGVNTARHWLTPDFMPAIGPWPGLSGVLVGTGWGGRATAFAAGAAAALVEHVTTGSIGVNIQDLAPNRFANGLWQVVRQPGSLSWQEPRLDIDTNMLGPKPEYMLNVNMVDVPKPEYANRVQQVEKKVTESAGRRPTVVVEAKTRKITTAAVKGE